MKRFFALLFAALWLCAVPLVLAQDVTEPATPTPVAVDGADSAEPTPPADETIVIPKIHVVGDGESLFYIANQYGVTIAEIQAANQLTNEDFLFVGQRLIIPGVQGEAVVTRYTVQFGDTPASIAAAFNTTPQALFDANPIINPVHLRAAQTLTVTSRTGSALPQAVTGTPHLVEAGDTWLTLAARHGVSAESLARLNGLPWPSPLAIGQRLRLPSAEPYQFLPDGWTQFSIRNHPLVQGQASSLIIDGLDVVNAVGRLSNAAGYSDTFQFARTSAGLTAIIGLDAFAEPGRYTLEITGEGSRPYHPLTYDLTLLPGDYGFQQITVSEEIAPLLSPEVRAEEDAFLAQYYLQFTPEQRWSGPFTPPIDNSFVSAAYGAARSYNGGPYAIFHTGTDYAAPEATPLLASTNGVVVFSDVTPIRGNLVIIDHGLGVMTSYAHMSQRTVSVGDSVSAGQVIGGLGNTGLSTGAHLHWEVRVRNVPVNAVQWLTSTFP